MWNDRLIMNRDQIREYDRIAIQEYGIPGPVLMENAGRGAARRIMKRLGGRRKVGIVAGPGNNGGDGFVIARHLMNSGVDVTTFAVAPLDKVKGDAKINLDILRKMGGEIVDVAGAERFGDLARRLAHKDLLVDAVLGTGVSRNVEGWLGEVIDIINSVRRVIVAIDIPSGLDADNGRPRGRAVAASATCTFGHLKKGLTLYPGAALAGEVDVIPIGVPGNVSEEAGFEGAVISEAQVRGCFADRETDGHKGTFGHLLVVGGLPGKTGAAALVGHAAMRIGTGLVTLATTADAQPVLESKCLEVMVDHLLENPCSPVTEEVSMKLDVLLEGKGAVALGPGLGTERGIAELALLLLDRIDVPAVIDADGINILAARSEGKISFENPTVLTPHPGEMARLVKKSVREVQGDRFGMSKAVAEQSGAVVVLKGANTVIAGPDGRMFVNPTGNPGMASGGMGDVLTGIIGGLLAQGLEPLDAAVAGVYLHGLAGDRAVSQTGQAALLASDIMEDLPGDFAMWGI